MPQTLKERINDALLEKKLLTQEQLKEALGLQSERGGKLSQILIDLEFIKEKDLISILSQYLNIPTISLSKYKIDPALIDLIPRKLARRYGLPQAIYYEWGGIGRESDSRVLIMK